MTRITQTKLNRRIFKYLGDDKQGKPIYGKCIGYQPPAPKQEVVVNLRGGAKMKFKVAPGQVVSHRAEFERQVKKGTIIYPEGVRT
jgi:hypothetical protein